MCAATNCCDSDSHAITIDLNQQNLTDIISNSRSSNVDPSDYFDLSRLNNSTKKDSCHLFFIYLFSVLLTINLKLIIVHIEIKIVNKEAATKRSTLLHAQRVHGRCTFEQSDVMLIRKGKRKEDN